MLTYTEENYIWVDNHTLDLINMISDLSNDWPYNPTHTKEMIDAIQIKLDELKRKFELNDK